MDIDVKRIVDQFAPIDAMRVLSLFLAQKDEPQKPHEELGFSTQQAAFEQIGSIFGYNPHTVKLTRDSFDFHTESARVGWQEELRPALKEIIDKFGSLSRAELLEISREILSREWTPMANKQKINDALFSKIENADSKTKIKPAFSGVVITFSNTGQGAGGRKWFTVTIDQLVSNLSDMINKLAAFQAAGPDYVEANWRKAFEDNLSDEVSRALAGTQTLPYFSLLAKIIHYANSDAPYIDKRIDLDEAKIRIALDTLKRIAANGLAEIEAPDADDVERLAGGNNTIYYGAPGTGKSYRVDSLSKDAHVIRTVFHPDVQNSDFVGSLKPVREDGDITYRFSPGPFAIALVDAMNNPGKEVWLVIEELNRAPAAAVFGDLFLLLDRDEDGTGEYDVNCPSEEFALWYEEQTGEKSGKIRLPSNLWIAATMNSADQGVYPLDTAFRRRWIQEYIPIEYDKGPDGKITVMQTGGGEISLDWRAFVKILNDHLTDVLSIAEDRLVGPWFVKKDELGDAGVLPGKVLIYLWDDLLRHHGRGVIFNGGIKSYGSLSTKSGSGEAIFSEGFLSRIIKDAKPGADE